MSQHTDLTGQKYLSPDNKPASHGTSVTIFTANGPKQGTMSGGYVVPDKK